MSATAGDPDPYELPDPQVLDPSRLAERWVPPVGLILHLREPFPTGPRRAGRGIRLALQTPDNYEDCLFHG